jgi:hypothetical protein
MQEMQCKHPPFIQLFYYINYCSLVKLRVMIALEEKLTGEDLFPHDGLSTYREELLTPDHWWWLACKKFLMAPQQSADELR